MLWRTIRQEGARECLQQGREKDRNDADHTLSPHHRKGEGIGRPSINE